MTIFGSTIIIAKGKFDLKSTLFNANASIANEKNKMTIRIKIANL